MQIKGFPRFYGFWKCLDYLLNYVDLHETKSSEGKVKNFSHRINLVMDWWSHMGTICRNSSWSLSYFSFSCHTCCHHLYNNTSSHFVSSCWYLRHESWWHTDSAGPWSVNTWLWDDQWLDCLVHVFRCQQKMKIIVWDILTRIWLKFCSWWMRMKPEQRNDERFFFALCYGNANW